MCTHAHSVHDRVIVDNMSALDRRETKSNLYLKQQHLTLEPSGVLLAFLHQHLPRCFWYACPVLGTLSVPDVVLMSPIFTRRCNHSVGFWIRTDISDKVTENTSGAGEHWPVTREISFGGRPTGNRMFCSRSLVTNTCVFCAS